MRAATLGTTTSSASFESASRTTCADRSCCVFFTGFISLLLTFGPIWILRPPPSELSRSCPSRPPYGTGFEHRFSGYSLRDHVALPDTGRWRRGSVYRPGCHFVPRATGSRRDQPL